MARGVTKLAAARMKQAAAVTKPYQQTPEERVAVAAMAARTTDLPVTPRVKVSEKGGVAQLSPDHPDFAAGRRPHRNRRCAPN